MIGDETTKKNHSYSFYRFKHQTHKKQNQGCSID